MLKILPARLQDYMNHDLQMFKLDLEKLEEPQIKLTTSAGSSKKQDFQNASCEMPDWMKHAGLKIEGRNINNLRYADDTMPMAESEKELKSFLMKVK